MKTRSGLAVVLLVATLAGVACKPADPPAEAPAATVGVDRVAFKPGVKELSAFAVAAVGSSSERGLRLTGRLAWDEDATVRVLPPVAGRVVQVRATIGDPVSRGATLARIVSPDFGQAQADAARAAADLRQAERTLERAKALLEHGAAARKDVEVAGADYERSRTESARAEARLALLGGAGEEVDQQFALAAPVAGIVVDRAINPGMEVRPDASVPLFVISDPRRLWVWLDIPERELARFHRGMKLRLTCQAYPGHTFEGTLDAPGESLDPATRTVRARGSVSNTERLLKAEMYVEVEAFDGDHTLLPEVPAMAVVSKGETAYVFREEAPAAFVRREVTLGRERDGRVLVVRGLSIGDRVVTEGSLLLETMLESRS